MVTFLFTIAQLLFAFNLTKENYLFTKKGKVVLEIKTIY